MAAMIWSCHDHSMIMAKHGHYYAMMTAWRPCFLPFIVWLSCFPLFILCSWHGLHDFAMIIVWSPWFRHDHDMATMIFFLKLSDKVYTVNQVHRFYYWGPYAVILRRHSACETHCYPHNRSNDKNFTSNGCQKKPKKYHTKTKAPLFW